uniref:Zinc finger protein-like 1 homolog n=1 Tax=Corethrella appendiculata TaxID=1370023 RepID=U5EWY3_9DIPT
MGLCKCPKRQVTTQFCFEHRVNVCENCMVVNHKKCTVQSYIQWLKDSDYDSLCSLCGSLLDNEDCVRLICYHVFHWGCLNHRQQSLPANTAPSGHQCPICNDPIFPPQNLVSPVADVLRTLLGQVNWGRNELGLPLLLDEKKTFSTTSNSSNLQNGNIFSNSIAQSRTNAAGSLSNSADNRPETPHSIVNIDTFNANSGSDFHANSRRSLLVRESPIGSDRDENKYKRRTPQEIFSRWSRRLYAPTAKPIWRKTWFLVLSGFLGFILLIYIMATLGRNNTENDPMFDMNLNPNIMHEQ